MILIFIDGPLATETKPWPDAPPTFYVQLPKRITTCGCGNDYGNEEEYLPEDFRYNRLTTGPMVAIYSKETKDDAILNALKYWVETDLNKDWHFGCRDRRAFQ